MSGQTSRLFAAEREASIRYEIALKEQYGEDYAHYRHRPSTHNDRTMAAMDAQSRALVAWHRSASGYMR